jgi:hypothetical protein
MTSVKFRGLESNQRPPGSEPGVTTSSNCPGSRLHKRHAPLVAVHGQVRGAGLEPASPGSKPGSLPLADPRSNQVPCGNRTRLASLEGWHLCRSAKGTTSCGGRNRTCVGVINSHLPVPARVPPQNQSARLESNQHLRAPEARGLSISPTRRINERPAGIEPALPPWQGSRLPLHHGRL